MLLISLGFGIFRTGAARKLLVRITHLNVKTRLVHEQEIVKLTDGKRDGKSTATLFCFIIFSIQL